MKKYTSLFLICLAFAGCSKSPGSRETGYQGIAWGSNAASVAKALKVTSSPASVDSLFANYYQGSETKVGGLLKNGFFKLATGKVTPLPNAIDMPGTMSMLNQGKAGYSLFFNKRFGMNLSLIPTSDYQAEHNMLMKQYGVIDKKVEYRAGEFETSYLIQWHNADGVIILAKETYNTDPTHRATSTQIIHMDKHVFDTLSRRLSKTGP